MTQRRVIRAFDLFCGGGGSSLGAKQAGATPVGGVDLWPVATEAYSLNLPRTRTYTADLNQLDPRQVADEIGPVDLLLASPECTNHSIAKGNKPRCENSKQLAFQVIRFAERWEPRWIVVENVIQMRSWQLFPTWLRELEQLGYDVLPDVFDAHDFGVPQSRRRLFVICDRERKPSRPRTYRKKGATVASILDKGQRGGWSYSFSPLENGRRAQKTLERAERAMRAVGKGEKFVMVYYGSDAAGGFQTLNRPLRTVTTLDRFAVVQPNCVGYEMRMFQPKELAIAMGFPPNYRFPNSATRRNCVKLMGNAVCPPIMRAIVRAQIKLDRVQNSGS